MLLRSGLRQFSCFGLLGFLVFPGCAVGADVLPEEEREDSDEAIVSTSQPYACSPASGDLWPSTSMSGQFAQQGIVGTEAPATGHYANGKDMAAGPALSETSWKSSSVGDECFTHAPAYADKMSEALSAANDQMVVTWEDGKGPFDALESFLSSLGVPVTADKGVDPTKFYGYAPERARWLRYQYVRTTGYLPMDVKHSYAEPAPLKDFRLRGARTYCAFKEAQRQQAGVTHAMGEMPTISVHILGKQVDFLVVKPTVALGAPQKHLTAAPDGAQAFTVPLSFGTAITPVKGIGLPGMREIRSPVAIVSGDSEISRKALLSDITSYTFVNGVPKRVTKKDYKKEYRAASHNDAVLTKGQHASLNTSFPLMYIGPVKVSTSFGLTLNAGASVGSNDRVLVNAYPYGSFPGGARTGWNGSVGATWFHDGAWTTYSGPCTLYCPAGFRIFPESESDPYWRMPFSEIGPMTTRAFLDDDRHVTSSTSLELTMGLSASLGGSFGPVSVTLNAGGNITGTVVQHHELRDALWAQGPHPAKNRGMAASGVSVRPRTEANATLNPLNVWLHFELDLWLDTIEWDAEMLKVPGVTLADYDSDTTKAWSEASALRVGVGSEAGDSMKQPTVSSHLPGAGTHASFPTNVDQCLADPPSEESLPDPCEAAPATGEPPRAELCAYSLFGTPSMFYVPPPTNICANIPKHAKAMALSPALEPSTTELLKFFCRPVSKEQSYDTMYTAVAHVTSTEAAMNELVGLLEACGHKALLEGYSEEAVKAWFSRLVKFGPCDSNAQLIKPDQVIAAAGDPTQAPTPSAASTCQ